MKCAIDPAFDSPRVGVLRGECHCPRCDSVRLTPDKSTSYKAVFKVKI